MCIAEVKYPKPKRPVPPSREHNIISHGKAPPPSWPQFLWPFVQLVPNPILFPRVSAPVPFLSAQI